MINNERTYMKQCVECGCTPKNDEWAVNSDKYCIDCEHEQNDWENACGEEEQERANHIAKSMDRGEL
jgi:hypothetical protein